MKIPKKNIVFIFVLMIFVTLLSCGEKIIEYAPDKCSTNPCTNLLGFDCVEGICICSKGNYRMGDVCNSLNDNEFYGTSNCSILDTIKIDFRSQTQIDNRIATILTTKNFSTQMDGLRYRDSVQSLDSLALLFPRTFKKDTIECVVKASGRFLSSTQLKLKLKYFAIFQNNRLIDSCQIVLHK